MDLSKYQELTGESVASTKATYMQAQIKRAQSMLETMLGFTLDPLLVKTNLYNEVGKSTVEYTCPTVDIETLELDDPDTVVGAYRLFPYNASDKYVHIDPYSEIYKVKLVFVKSGEDNKGYTLKTFDEDDVRLEIGRNGVGRFIEFCEGCLYECSCYQGYCMQLAVDAKWLWESQDDVPIDLQYVLADMVKYYSDTKRDVKSESITTHSYSKFDVSEPETRPNNLSVIRTYAGPYGKAVVTPTIDASSRRVAIWL